MQNRDNHEIITPAGITCKKIFLQRQRATGYKQKQKYFSFPDHQLAENFILIFGFMKGKTRDKSEFVTKLVGVILTIIFV